MRNLSQAWHDQQNNRDPRGRYQTKLHTSADAGMDLDGGLADGPEPAVWQQPGFDWAEADLSTWTQGCAEAFRRGDTRALVAAMERDFGRLDRFDPGNAEHLSALAQHVADASPDVSAEVSHDASGRPDGLNVGVWVPGAGHRVTRWVDWDDFPEDTGFEAAMESADMIVESAETARANLVHVDAARRKANRERFERLTEVMDDFRDHQAEFPGMVTEQHRAMAEAVGRLHLELADDLVADEARARSVENRDAHIESRARASAFLEIADELAERDPDLAEALRRRAQA